MEMLLVSDALNLAVWNYCCLTSFCWGQAITLQTMLTFRCYA